MSKMTKEQRDALIKKHGEGNLRMLEIPTTESQTEFIEVVAIVPTRTVFGQFQKWSDANPKKASEILVRGCILTNREQIEANDFMFNTTLNVLAELVPMGEGRIKKF
ncbi:MAG: hypothetical protein V3V28_08650 [Polaribacter sp.]|uniref:hypothetical protein n=1 Tax=Polaribacter sp. TaxID=1920175 RepID=UPI002F35895C